MKYAYLVLAALALLTTFTSVLALDVVSFYVTAIAGMLLIVAGMLRSRHDLKKQNSGI